MDECHFQQHGSRLAAWFPPEEKDPVLKHAPVRNKVGIVGAVRVNDGTMVACEQDKFNAQTIEVFLTELVKRHDKTSLWLLFWIMPDSTMPKPFRDGWNNIHRIFVWISCHRIVRNLIPLSVFGR